MGVIWTEEQQKVISLRDRNILVSACSWLRKNGCACTEDIKQDHGYRKTSGH